MVADSTRFVVVGGDGAGFRFGVLADGARCAFYLLPIESYRDGCNVFVLLVLLKELILINNFVLKVSSEVRLVMDFSKNDFVAVGDNDKRESFENVTLGECDEIKIGMQVRSEEEAYNLYNQYALKRGFSIRKAVKREYNGVIRQREFVCSKQGFKEFEDPSNVKKYHNLDVRTGCRARIRFDVKNDIWSVSHFNDTHNHEFATPEERCNLRSGRKVLPAHGNIISTMVSSVIKFYEEKAAQMRQDEINEDFRCKNGAPGKVHKHGGILSHAAKVYTLALFGMFEEEFDSAMDSLSELLCKLEKSSGDTNKMEDIGKKCPQDLIHDDDVQPCLDGKRPILDPPHVRKKGITNFRIKSQLEKKQRKKKVKDATTSKAPKAISMVFGKKTSGVGGWKQRERETVLGVFLTRQRSVSSDDARQRLSRFGVET
ncbi:hypothetical protein CMV_010762 [Castanea mollissima]|uniref:FAR1 domain-containing protein n=1 Tax=Castanea mollissima TaxID=60419 RepID=A0A8J4RIQ2_9ROSI|nr:hypothetical protein CMV_010762 [Castanea mollissima]